MNLVNPTTDTTMAMAGETMLGVQAFLRAYLKVSPNTSVEVARKALSTTMKLEAGVHYDHSWLEAQLTQPSEPASAGSARSRGETTTTTVSAVGESAPSAKTAPAAAASAVPDAMSTPTRDADGERTMDVDDGLRPPAPPATPHQAVKPIVNARGHDITKLKITVPAGAAPGAFLSFKIHDHPSVPRMLAEVPPLAEPGDTFVYANAVWWPEHGEPVPTDFQLLPVPRRKTLDLLLDGFAGLTIPRNTPITKIPIVVFNVPAPRPGDDLHCYQHRFADWVLVEAEGVPQPGAWSTHERGSSYEEVRPDAAPVDARRARAWCPSLRSPFPLLTRAPLPSCAPPCQFLLQQNLGLLPIDFGHQVGTRLLRLLHLKTRSVCQSRLDLWRKGARWALREEADYDLPGAYNGVSFTCLTPLDKQLTRTSDAPCTGAVDKAETLRRWQKEREENEAAKAEAAAAEAAAKAAAEAAEAAANAAANAAAKGPAKGSRKGKGSSKKRGKEAKPPALPPPEPNHDESEEATDPVPYAAWPDELAGAPPTSSHDRSQPRPTAYHHAKWRDAERDRRAKLQAASLERKEATKARIEAELHLARVEAEEKARLDELKLQAVDVSQEAFDNVKKASGASPLSTTLPTPARAHPRSHASPSPCCTQIALEAPELLTERNYELLGHVRAHADEVLARRAAEAAEPAPVPAPPPPASPASEAGKEEDEQDRAERPCLAIKPADACGDAAPVDICGACASESEDGFASDDDGQEEGDEGDDWRAQPIGPPLPSEELLGGLCMGSHVRTVGLVTHAEMNGLHGLVIGFDVVKQRYTVLVEGHEAHCSLLPTNLERWTESDLRKPILPRGDDELMGEGEAAEAQEYPLHDSPSISNLEPVAHPHAEGGVLSSHLSLLASLAPVVEETVTPDGVIPRIVSASSMDPEVLFGEAARESEMPIADVRLLSEDVMHLHNKVMWCQVLPDVVKRTMTRLVDNHLLGWEDLLEDGNLFWEIAFTEKPIWPEPERWHVRARQTRRAAPGHTSRPLLPTPRPRPAHPSPPFSR